MVALQSSKYNILEQIHRFHQNLGQSKKWYHIHGFNSLLKTSPKVQFLCLSKSWFTEHPDQRLHPIGSFLPTSASGGTPTG